MIDVAAFAIAFCATPGCPACAPKAVVTAVAISTAVGPCGIAAATAAAMSTAVNAAGAGGAP